MFYEKSFCLFLLKNPQLNSSEIQAVVNAAHSLGLKVASHATSASAAQIAYDNGTRIIEL